MKSLKNEAQSYKKYLIIFLVVIFITTFFNYFLRAFPGFIGNIVVSEYGLSPSNYALIESLYFVPYVIVLFVFGILNYRCKIRSVWICFLVSLILSFLFFSFPSYLSFLSSCFFLLCYRLFPRTSINSP